MPTPGKAFNSTPVGYGSQYYEYEKTIDELFKPYTVPLPPRRTPTAKCSDTETGVTVAIYCAAI
jgi:hypothetical protein